MRLVAIVLVTFLSLVPGVVGAEEVKDPNPPDPNSLGTAARSTGGPDAFGYTFADGAEPGITFSWVDISGTGTSLGLTGDDAGIAVTLGAAFSFYGASVSQVSMTTNGYISTLSTDLGPDFSNDCPLPTTPSTGGGDRIYVLQDDLIVESGVGAMFYQYFAACPRANSRWTVPEACSVLMWDEVRHLGGSVYWDQEAILYHSSGDIVVQIGPGNPEAGSGSTTGIQNLAATIGLTYACNTGSSIPDNTVVQFINTNNAPPQVNADLAISKAADATGPVEPGDQVVYTITVTNNGPAAASGVVVTDTFPAGQTYLSDTCGGSYAGGTWTWNVGALADQAQASCSVTVLVGAGAAGAVVNTATVAGNEGDPATADNTGSATITVQARAIPAAGPIGIGLLVLLLASGGILVLRRVL